MQFKLPSFHEYISLSMYNPLERVRISMTDFDFVKMYKNRTIFSNKNHYAFVCTEKMKIIY